MYPDRTIEITSERVTGPEPCQKCPMITKASEAISTALTWMMIINIFPLAWSVFNFIQNSAKTIEVPTTELIASIMFVVSIAMLPLSIASLWLLYHLNKFTRGTHHE